MHPPRNARRRAWVRRLKSAPRGRRTPVRHSHMVAGPQDFRRLVVETAVLSGAVLSNRTASGDVDLENVVTTHRFQASTTGGCGRAKRRTRSGALAPKGSQRILQAGAACASSGDSIKNRASRPAWLGKLYPEFAGLSQRRHDGGARRAAPDPRRQHHPHRRRAPFNLKRAVDRFQFLVSDCATSGSHVIGTPPVR